VERIALGIRARELTCPTIVNGPENVVIREEMVEAHLLCRGAELPNRRRVAAKFVLRIRDTGLHQPQPATSEGTSPLTLGLHRRCSAIRDLFTQQPVGTNIWTALAGCVGILVVAYLFAMATYHRRIS
jgi:hypothetical protein